MFSSVDSYGISQYDINAVTKPKIMHELGHYLVAKHFGYCPTKISITPEDTPKIISDSNIEPTGIAIDGEITSAEHTLAIAFAGIVAETASINTNGVSFKDDSTIFWQLRQLPSGCSSDKSKVDNALSELVKDKNTQEEKSDACKSAYDKALATCKNIVAKHGSGMDNAANDLLKGIKETDKQYIYMASELDKYF